MNEQRRKKAIALLRNTIDACERIPLKSNEHVPQACRDILTMLNEREELPWRVWDSDASEWTAAFADRCEADNYLNEEMGGRGFITGPDAKSDIDRIVGKASNGMPTTHKYAPTITFKPWTPPRPTLDKMLEGEPHRCKGPLKQQCVMMKNDGQAWSVDTDGNALQVSGFGLNRYTVLDADSAQPETLGDVPAGVWCESSEGGLCVRSTTKPDRVIWLTSHRDGPENETAQCELIKPYEIEIARVLGTPVFSEGGE